jgi:hypothetical protein
MADAAAIALAEREAGKARNGEVHLRDFDRGVVETFGGKVIDSNYYLTNVTGVLAPPNMPGIPINFAFPEDTADEYIFPSVIITREDISPATNRFHPGLTQYRAPALGAQPVQVQWGQRVLNGWNKMADRPQAVTYDISYQISVLAYRRGVPQRGNANALLEYVMAWYQPYTAVKVLDSIGDLRTYFATTDSASPLDDVVQIGERIIGWQIPMVVEAELDLNPEFTHVTATSMALNMSLYLGAK